MNSHEIRQTFTNYFKKHGHEHVKSSGLIPENDATLLFCNAGMNQFKNTFLGLEPRGYNRAVTVQKCVRAGGKHNDLENVGFTARHHTFFEMLGNFSFGDYFKKDAIHFAWDLLTKEFAIPKERLYVTVFQDDDEAADIWHKQEGVARDRIYRFGEKDNFWRMGDTGPCGPCSEIFYDHGAGADAGAATPSQMGGDGDRFVEIWNLVFMQFNEDGKGRHALPKPSVDTGGGIERWAAALQGHFNNYDTDFFTPMIHKAAQVAKKDYVSDLKTLQKHPEMREVTSALRVLADHSRATAFLIADGVLPSNEGRGYVLRRMMRRAIRYGRKLTDDPSLLQQTVAVVIAQMSDVYPELGARKSVILATVQDEVTRFLQTLDQGTEILEGELKKLSGRGLKTLDGELVFKLYDTFGFPVDLTRLMAVEKGFTVDEAAFHSRMEQAREKAKASWKGQGITADAAHLTKFAQGARERGGVTVFRGYKDTELSSLVAAISNGSQEVKTLGTGAKGIVICEDTPFYAESGGQVGDHGTLRWPGGSAEVFDCTKQNEMHLLHVHVHEGELRNGEEVLQTVTASKRRATASNHSATHLMHSALRTVLGEQVTQAGSLVDDQRTRFDFSHNRALTPHEIARIEDLVNAEIAKGVDVSSAEMEHKEAIAMGAMALFGEKYGDQVRVIRMGSFSCELCGGTHVSNTAQIRLFKIVSESGVSAGVRRIEAITGDVALQFLGKNTRENLEARFALGINENWAAYLYENDLQSTSVPLKIAEAGEKAKELFRQVQLLKSSKINLDDFLGQGKPFTVDGVGGKLVLAHVEVDDRKVLSETIDKLKDKLGSGVVVLVGKGEKSHPILVTVSKDLTGKLSAGKILSEVAGIMKGKGGGRPDFAQGAGEDLSQLATAFSKARALLGI